MTLSERISQASVEQTREMLGAFCHCPLHTLDKLHGRKEVSDAAEFWAQLWEVRGVPTVAKGIRNGNLDDLDRKAIALIEAKFAELGTPKECGDNQWNVSEGQTPLDEKLRHRYLDVIKDGELSRDSGKGSPYSGQSLEHCLHSTGWLIRDLRLALQAQMSLMSLMRKGENK